MKPLKILVTGDRHWDDLETMYHLFNDEIFKDKSIRIIHGAAKGADTMAGFLGKEFGWEVEVYSADWTKYKRAAGPIRNREMFKTSKPHIVFWFHDDLTNSKGTKDMVSVAIKACSTASKTICERIEREELIMICGFQSSKLLNHHDRDLIHAIWMKLNPLQSISLNMVR